MTTRRYTREEVQAAAAQLVVRLRGRRDMNQATAEAGDTARDPWVELRARARVQAYQQAMSDVLDVFGGGLLASGPTVARTRRRPQKGR